MNRITLFITLALLLGAQQLRAADPIVIKLWDTKAAPYDNALGETEDNTPTLAVYPAAHPNGMAVIACPGGAYAYLAMNHEGHSMAQWMNSMGITYAVLKYRLPNGHNEVPLCDAERAISLMRENAGKWGVNPSKVGIMGSSAGGHLATTAATHYHSTATRPDFQILLYPVVTMSQATHAGSRENLLGKNPSEELIKTYSNENRVTKDTPTAFIVLSSDDATVPPVNSINYYLALQRCGVPVSMHVYPIGGHGWGFLDSFIYKRQWTEELEKWLREL